MYQLIFFPDAPAQLEAVHIRHADIRYYDINRYLPRKAQRLCPVVDRRHNLQAELRPRNMCLQMRNHVLFIVRDQYLQQSGRVLAVCHVLRYTPFYQTLKRLITEGAIGTVASLTQIKNVAYWHHAHSFVRGNWRNAEETSPMILQKSCHDTDILLWLVGRDCKQVSSFGSLRHFDAAHAPKDAPQRCLEGCPYYAPKLYLTENIGWPVDILTTDLSYEGRRKALLEGPYGR